MDLCTSGEHGDKKANPRTCSSPRPKQVRSREARQGSNVHWKPLSLKTPILGGLIAFSLTMIIVLEVLSHKSSGNGNMNSGGIAFAPDVNSFSTSTIFMQDPPTSLVVQYFRFMPTILAVLHNMVWSWVDLNTKRIEPWLQLSKEKGAAAKNSLLMQYPFDFLPFIPFTACRRKHWGVFFSGLIMLIVLWIITPLQSAIFHTGTVVRSIPATMVTDSSLVPLENQTDVLNANFLNMGYGIAWLNQRLPAFTTAEFALLPFRPLEMTSTVPNSESWSTTVDAYSTNLTCTTAIVTLGEEGYAFDNGRGCFVPEINFGQGANYLVSYIGYYENENLDFGLQNPNCSEEFANNFLAVWASPVTPDGPLISNNVTALFCETSYHSRKMYVQVNASSTQEVYTATAASPNTTSPTVESIFNTTNFENILSIGNVPNPQRANVEDESVLEQSQRMKNYNIGLPISNMAGFAIALNPLSVEDLVAPSALQAAFQNAHQLLFTTAFSSLTETSSEPQLSTMDGVRYETVGAIVLVRPISIIVEVAYGILSLLTACLWYIYRKQQSNLSRDPASIADIMTIVGRDFTSEVSLDLSSDEGTLTANRLAEALSTQYFSLTKSTDSDQASGLRALKPRLPEVPPRQSIESYTSKSSSRKSFTPVCPSELSMTAGAALIGILILSLIIITFLEVISGENDGINPPSNNPVVLSILENYLPTAFSTFLEPVWVVLNRLLCLLKPFEELRKGNANASATLEAKYTSVPPQLAIWQAAQSRHLLLVSVCFVAFSFNILAVALSGLIFQGSTTTVIPSTASQKLLPQINDTSILYPPSLLDQCFDHFYVALSNLSSGASLPAWVDEKYFYLPFELQAPPTASKAGIPLDFEGFRGSTTGFGTESTCVELSSGPSDNSVQFQSTYNDESALFTTSYTLSNGSRVTCFSDVWGLSSDTNVGTRLPDDGPSAFEAMQAMTSASSDSTNFCSLIMVAGWVRLGSQVDKMASGANIITYLDRSLDYTFLSCTQKLQIATFDVNVDSTGHILSANQTGDFVEDTALYFSGNASENSLFQQSNGLIAPYLGNSWHNDSFTSDWVNTLLELVSNSSNALVNPTAPVPRAADVAPLVQNIYQLLFAIILSLNTDVFSQSENPIPITVEAVVAQPKIFLSKSMFVLSITLLSLHLIVAILYYAYRPKRFLPRMPTSIASIIGFVWASHALEDFAPDRRNKHQETKYGYGRFIGIDGKMHVGIERQRNLIPLEIQNPEVKRRNWALEEDD